MGLVVSMGEWRLWVGGLCNRPGGPVGDEVSGGVVGHCGGLRGHCGTPLEVGNTMKVWRFCSKLGSTVEGWVVPWSLSSLEGP